MLRVVSYNIHSGRDLFWRKRLHHMAETLLSLDADVIGLQEVHQNHRFGYQASYLSDLLHYDYAFAPALPLADGAYGNALLTRIPLVSAHTQPLPAKKEPRNLLRTTLLWQKQQIDVWVTHCSLDQKSRMQQCKVLNREASLNSERPLLLLGDFNTDQPLLPPFLQDCAKKKERHLLPTMTLFNKRVDFTFASTPWHVDDYQVIGVSWSDHYPLLTTLTLTPPPIPAK